MNVIERERIKNYVKDMDKEEAQHLVRQLDSEFMFCFMSWPDVKS